MYVKYNMSLQMASLLENETTFTIRNINFRNEQDNISSD